MTTAIQAVDNSGQSAQQAASTSDQAASAFGSHNNYHSCRSARP